MFGIGEPQLWHFFAACLARHEARALLGAETLMPHRAGE
jgi:hypothetical protein